MKFDFSPLALASCLLSIPAVYGAECEQFNGVCRHLQGSKLIKQSSCKIEECSGGSKQQQKWNFKGKTVVIDGVMVNEKPAFSMGGKPAFQIEKGAFYCYGLEEKKEKLFCLNEK